jgi:hypothetical protein
MDRPKTVNKPRTKAPFQGHFRSASMGVGERLGNPKVSSGAELSTYSILWKIEVLPANFNQNLTVNESGLENQGI